MKCAECDNRSNNTGAKCWVKWGLCGDCAIKKHPTEYRGQIKARETFYAEQKRRIQSCPNCREMMVKLYYNKLGHRSLNCFYCINCKILKSIDSGLKWHQDSMK